MSYLEDNPEDNRFDLASVFQKTRNPDAHPHQQTVIGCGQRIVLYSQVRDSFPQLLETSAWSFIAVDDV